MKIHDDQMIAERVAVLEAALEKLLDRDSTMSVELSGDPGTMAVYVSSRCCLCAEHRSERSSFSLNKLARELEVLLS
ncbi:hypothetical protein ACFSDD_09080 [Salipiger marinus]|uniref:hypothetical protein n=1 Tax=Salipiger marinus TaxID=555512 RepID=UPI002CC3864B|nr:hypothetical protein [Salipiger manganoxidans]MEB3421909.1 hypothetical protein [Salipiger manganoxidans]